jgi:hypothetical protein
MTNFIYRLDGAATLAAITTSSVGARRWTSDSPLHPFLRARSDKLSDAERIYRMCFWTSLEKALVTKERDYKSFPDTVLLRCTETVLQDAGFHRTWDDAVREGDAFMFWIVEQTSSTNQTFSDSSIPFDAFQVLVDTRWVSLPFYLSAAYRQLG